MGSNEAKVGHAKTRSHYGIRLLRPVTSAFLGELRTRADAHSISSVCRQ